MLMWISQLGKENEMNNETEILARKIRACFKETDYIIDIVHALIACLANAISTVRLESQEFFIEESTKYLRNTVAAVQEKKAGKNEAQ
jgi:branched-subunit amino acid permease